MLRPSYGRVGEDGAPADPDTYDYTRAARDALHFAALFDRFIQNLRRYTGYDLQYFAAIEPQRRLAPHIHLAIRGTISRAELREVIAATYHQVWWPSTEAVKYDGGHLPVWDEHTGTYLDPDTGEVLPTWDQALDAIGDQDEPLHVARFGARFDAQGVLAGSRDASRCIGYLTKYLTKHLGDCHQAATDAQAAHAARLADALRYEPCSPTCANWLRYGIQPRNARPACGQAPARAKPTAASTSATPGAASWSPGSGPARPSPTTAPTARTGSPACSAFRQPTRPGTPGSRSIPATRTTCPTGNGSCTSSPTASNGKPRLQRQDDKPKAAATIFRQMGGRRDERESESRWYLRCGCCISAPRSRPSRQVSKGMTLAELLALPLMVDVSTAARALGLSRSTGYELARRGEFPCRVLHVGSSYRVPIAELLRVLGIDLSELSPRFPAA